MTNVSQTRTVKPRRRSMIKIIVPPSVSPNYRAPWQRFSDPMGGVWTDNAAGTGGRRGTKDCIEMVSTGNCI